MQASIFFTVFAFVFSIVDLGLAQQECTCSKGTPATGDDCVPPYGEVCASCDAEGFELIKFDFKETGTCEAIIQELCDCRHGHVGEGSDCTIMSDEVIAAPSADKWSASDAFQSCAGSTFDHRSDSAFSITKGACDDDDGDFVSAFTSVAENAKQVLITFKFMEACEYDCAPLVVDLYESGSSEFDYNFRWCVGAQSIPHCDVSHPFPDGQGVEKTLVFQFRAFSEKYSNPPTSPMLRLSVYADGVSQTTDIRSVQFQEKHYYNKEEDDVCQSCFSGFELVRHPDKQTGYCQAITQAKCACPNGVPAVGAQCNQPNAQVCAACHSGFTLANGACQATTLRIAQDPVVISGDITMHIANAEVHMPSLAAAIAKVAHVYLKYVEVNIGLTTLAATTPVPTYFATTPGLTAGGTTPFVDTTRGGVVYPRRLVYGHYGQYNFNVRIPAGATYSLSELESFNVKQKVENALAAELGIAPGNININTFNFQVKESVGTIESMPAFAAGAPGAAANALGASSLPQMFASRIDCSVVGLVAGLSVAGFFIGSRAARASEQYFKDDGLVLVASGEDSA